MGGQVPPSWQPVHWLAVIDVDVHHVVGQTAMPAVVPTVEPTVVLIVVLSQNTD